MQKIHAKVTSVEFDHDGELSSDEVNELTKEVLEHDFSFYIDDYCDVSSVADAVSDLTGWCVLDINYTTETK